MSLILHGTQPSPFVRRIRLLLDGVDHEFREVPLYDDAGRQQFAAVSPIRKVPVLEDNGQTIFDSHVIFHYLQNKLGLPALTLDQHNLISVIDAVTDSCVVLVLGKRSELAIEEDRMIFRLQRERIADSLRWLEQQVIDGSFDDWSYPTMCLVTMVDWLKFRQLHDFVDQPALQALVASHAERPVVQLTLPR
ncbi:glutathione S-transferase family protein [Oceanobacter mangrovi]|uniref:glutathione S-transferase family protein n=1 Tax=Oceanobacter mangrovi TaxID=2862510 RepID=UPI001C8DCEBF|nr:glutathione S-transferase family protein [Oceanobacter mangrovi]